MAFIRPDSGWRRWIKADGSTDFLPEAGRYHLYVSLACPWACRCLVLRALKGLEEVIPVTIVSPLMRRTRPDDPEDKHEGWFFATAEEFDRCSPDPLGFKTIRDLYEKAKDTVGKYSVPVLWDNKNMTIVNNESSEIIRMFDGEFNALAKNPQLILSPPELMKEIEEVNSWVYPMINNGVYRCGFAKSQEAYDEAIADVVAGVDRAEKILSTQRYLCGKRFTEADIRLFVTLVRSDSVYVVHFKTNKARIADRPNLVNYMREIYQMPGVADTVDLNHINNGYYRMVSINPFGIVAAAPDSGFDLPHDRARLEGEPVHFA